MTDAALALGASWDYRAHYAAIKARVAPMAIVRTPVVVRPVACRKGRVIYAHAIGPQMPSKTNQKRFATNSRPDLARCIYRHAVRIRRPRNGRTCYFYPIGPKPPAVLPEAGEKTSAKRIIAEEIERSGLTWEQLLAPTRAHRYAVSRRRLYWRLYCETKLSLLQVGALVHRDHTTILHAVRRHEEITRGVAQ